jgi:hypothetical protein
MPRADLVSPDDRVVRVGRHGIYLRLRAPRTEWKTVHTGFSLRFVVGRHVSCQQFHARCAGPHPALTAIRGQGPLRPGADSAQSFSFEGAVLVAAVGAKFEPRGTPVPDERPPRARGSLAGDGARRISASPTI